MKPPLLAALLCALPFALAPAVGSAAVDPAEWEAAVAAAQDVDPTIEPLSPEAGSVTIVGGAKEVLGSAQTFAVSARQRLADVTGRMTLVVGSGTIFKASVVCIDAVTLPSGGGFAMVAGELDQPSGVNNALVFRITDSAQPGGEGDTWDQQTEQAVPQCVAAPGTQAVVAGNVVIDPGG